jgi:hypothetical protein
MKPRSSLVFLMKEEPAMTSVPQQVEALEQILEEEARLLAKETGFIERERAFNGADFAQALILGWLQRPDERLSGFTQILQRREVSITASGLSQRFTQEAATFMQRLLERLAEVQRPRGGSRCAALAPLECRHGGG